MSNHAAKSLEVLQALRFPMIVLVVMIHAIPFSDGQFTRFLPDVHLYESLVLNIARNLAFIAVPVFMLISGYLFYFKIADWHQQVFFRQFQKRVRTLLLPYLAWNMLFVAFILVKNRIFYLIGQPADSQYDLLQHSSILELFWSIPINYPLWFLRDLMVMVLLSPVIYYGVKYLKIGWLVLVFMTGLLFPLKEIPGFSLSMLFYFSLGAYFALFKKDFISDLRTQTYWIYALALSFGAWSCVYFDHHWFVWLNKVYVLFGTLAVMLLMDRLIRYTTIRMRLLDLSRYVFGIFVMHAIYILDWSRGLLAKIGLSSHEGGMIVQFFLLVGVTVLICITVQRLLEKLVPGVFYFLSGSRISQ